MPVNAQYLPILKETTHIVTIDPSARKSGGGCGLACFSMDSKYILPLQTKLVECQLENFDQRCLAIARTVWMFVQHVLTSVVGCSRLSVFIERPMYFVNSRKSLNISESGDLFKLTVAYARIFERIHGNGVTTYNLEINHWKGQLSKNMIKRRIEHITSQKYKLDINDAVGMGLYLKGKF